MQNEESRYGYYKWPSSKTLSGFILKNKDLFHGKIVVEIGCGTAICSVTAAKCGAAKVIATDKAIEKDERDIVKELVEKNFDANNVQCACYAPLTWGMMESVIRFCRTYPAIDIIIASDCFYDPSVFDDILFTLAYLLDKNPNCVVYFAYQIRSSDWSIEQLLNRYELTCELLPYESFENNSEILIDYSFIYFIVSKISEYKHFYIQVKIMNKSLSKFSQVTFCQRRFLPRFSRSTTLPTPEFAEKNENESGNGKILTTTSHVNRELIESKLNQIRPIRENKHLMEKSNVQRDLSAPEFYDGEDSFVKSKKTFEEHQEYRRKVRYQREIRKNTIREKETLLTWAAMDQIRELHDQDPQHWTPERISESFPISVQGARSFLHGKRPKNVTPERIKQHDEEVEKRWKALNSESQRNIDEDTKILIKTKQTKFMPLKGFHAEDETSIETEKELKLREEAQKLIDQPNDGPFMKMYRNHLRWRNAAKLDKNPTKVKVDGDDMNLNAEEIFESLAFRNLKNSKKGDNILDEEDKIIMNFKEFRTKMRKELKMSKNRLDQRYGRWIDEQERIERRSQ
uniref:Neugrin n=1 Tax=Romanomermis culicivorax TaxID=13658 RepID=A0A915HYA5_ROMCU